MMMNIPPNTSEMVGRIALAFAVVALASSAAHASPEVDQAWQVPAGSCIVHVGTSKWACHGIMRVHGGDMPGFAVMGDDGSVTNFDDNNVAAMEPGVDGETIKRVVIELAHPDRYRQFDGKGECLSTFSDAAKHNMIGLNCAAINIQKARLTVDFKGASKTIR
jgi:hypothetical protein